MTMKGPLFTFYWQQVSHWYNEYPVEYLIEEELGNLAFLELLPGCLPAMPIVNFLKSPNPIRGLECELFIFFMFFLYRIRFS